MKFLTITLPQSLLLIVSPLYSAAENDHPPHGYVPNAETAAQIAEAVLIPVYGKSHVESERPFNATLNNGVWVVIGTLYCSDDRGHRTAPGCDGGTAVVNIAKSNGRVLSMIHYK